MQIKTIAIKNSPIIIMIAIPVAITYYNWINPILSYQDLDIISKYYTILGAFIGAYWAWKKWQEEKKRSKHDKNLINVDYPFIAYLIRQETYRKLFLNDDNSCTREAMPIITSKITLANNHYKTDVNVTRDNFTTLLAKADKSYMSLDLQRLINQYLLLMSIEKMQREEIIVHCIQNGIFVNNAVPNTTAAVIKNILGGIYVNPKSPDVNQLGELGRQYSDIMTNIKLLDCQIIKKIIQEYTKDMDALNIPHDEITWENLAESEVHLSRIRQHSHTLQFLL